MPRSSVMVLSRVGGEKEHVSENMGWYWSKVPTQGGKINPFEMIKAEPIDCVVKIEAVNEG